jgi:hypothetical protein
VEEPCLEKLCELSDIEPGPVPFDVLTNSERRKIVERASVLEQTKKIFENEQTLEDFIDGICDEFTADSADEYPSYDRIRKSTGTGLKHSKKFDF